MLNFSETAKRRNGETASHRSAFTLVEMIVVITIMAILTVIAVAVAPRFQENQRVVKAADQISQWLLTARVRALRDQVATGVRLSPDPNNSSLVRGLQYIQQPDDFIVQPGVDLINSPQARRIIIARSSSSNMPPHYDLVDLEAVPPPPAPQPTVVSDFSGGFGPTAPPNNPLWPVQIGDYLEYQGTGLVHQIIGVSGSTLQLNPFGAPTSPISTSIRQYRIIRAPRVLTGETPLDLPKDVAIDGGQKFSGDPFSPPGDIMFSPNGGVMNNPGVAGKIILWIRDTSKDPSAPGEQFLVVIQVRTGFIAVHPVDAYSADPYRFTKDARSSGL
jgi:prepilin-type N-terminal cleavage/methylation domain-containing protein